MTPDVYAGSGRAVGKTSLSGCCASSPSSQLFPCSLHQPPPSGVGSLPIFFFGGLSCGEDVLLLCCDKYGFVVWRSHPKRPLLFFPLNIFSPPSFPHKRFYECAAKKAEKVFNSSLLLLTPDHKGHSLIFPCCFV